MRPAEMTGGKDVALGSIVDDGKATKSPTDLAPDFKSAEKASLAGDVARTNGQLRSLSNCNYRRSLE